MSYRSFKRVLGETSLERKCRFLFGACLLSLITGSFWWYSSVTEELVYKAHQTMGEGLADAALTRRHFEIWEKYETEGRSNFVKDFGKALDNRKQTYDPQIILPTELASLKDKELEQFLRRGTAENPPLAYLDRRKPETRQYEYYHPVRAKKQCTICHMTMVGFGNEAAGPDKMNYLADLKEGDLAAVVRIAISSDELQHELDKNRAILITTAIITVFLAMIASYVIVRYVIVKPLKHLRDVSDEISHGNISLRADIHTGDEFEELALAFNRMLRHLITIQQEIRNVNVDLDQKVDELAQANMRLYEMNRLKSDFLATMSHELRTPLNAIIGFSEVLESIASLDEKQKRYVKNIQTSGKVLLEMINDILDLAKIESGKMEVRLSDFRIEHVITAQCDMARPLTERKNIDLETKIEPGLPEMFQDQAKVQQILNNLLSNAIKFTPEGGRIVINAARASSSLLLLEVTDTGVGIADEDQTAIFEKFRQGRSVLTRGDAITREYSGTGLGLSIVKELCKLLGGEIALESQLGKGSTFTVRLPFTRTEQPKLDTLLPPVMDTPPGARRLEYAARVEATAAEVSLAAET